jgi:predicted Zn finger-like uncharacterized protein
MDQFIDVSCPNCSVKLRVKESLAGKKVKCKKCESVLTIPAAAKPLPAEFTKSPAKARAKPAAPAPVADAPIKLAGDDDDEDANPYIIIKDSDAPRCPHCAKELDPPDSLICLNCGYDLRDRNRKASRNVIAHTFGDYLLHHLLAVFLLLVGIGLIVLSIICWIYMESWVGSWIETGEKDANDKKAYYLKPWCFSLWIMLFIIWIDWKIFKYCANRFFINYTPPEKIVKKSD